MVLLLSRSAQAISTHLMSWLETCSASGSPCQTSHLIAEFYAALSTALVQQLIAARAKCDTPSSLVAAAAG